jgi:RluA family pseudouridine synthase
MLGFDILFEDESVLAVNKPAGVTTQAPPGLDSLEVRVRAYLAGAGRDPADVYLGLPHRLDRPVSGAILLAKTRRAARQLARQFERRRVRKVYWTCVERTVEPAAGTWTDFLYKIHGQPLTAVVDAAHPEGREAILHYRTLGHHQAGSWLEVELETGRTHQIRVQAASRGHPVLGDVQYGSRIPFGAPTDDERLREIALVARRIEFFHPMTKEPMTIEAPPSPAWASLDLTASTSTH